MIPSYLQWDRLIAVGDEPGGESGAEGYNGGGGGGGTPAPIDVRPSPPPASPPPVTTAPPASGPFPIPTITDIGGFYVPFHKLIDPVDTTENQPPSGNDPGTQGGGSGSGGGSGGSGGSGGGSGTGTGTNGNGSGTTTVTAPSTPLVPIPPGTTSDQGNSGADASALQALLSEFQGAFGNGGQSAGAAAPGTLVETPASGGTTDDTSAAPASVGINLTTVVLAAIVLGVAYVVYKHYKNKLPKALQGDTSKAK